MNISSHLLIDAVILSTALAITLVLRAKGNAARQEKGSKWLQKKKYTYINHRTTPIEYLYPVNFN